MCLGVFLFVFILSRTLVLPGLGYLFAYPMLWKFSAIIPLNIFSGPFSLFPCGAPIMWILVNVMLSQRSQAVFIYCFFFSFFFSILCFVAVVSTILSSRLLIHSSPSMILLLNPSSALFQRKQWQPTPVLLPGKSRGWKSLVGCIPWGC